MGEFINRSIRSDVVVVFIAIITLAGAAYANYILATSSETIGLIYFVGGWIIVVHTIVKILGDKKVGGVEFIILTYALLILLTGIIYLVTPGTVETIDFQPRIPDNIV